MVRSASLASLALLLLAPPAPARAAEEVPKEPGVYWEQSFEMQMSGFAMPAQKQKICLPQKGIQEPPQSDRDQKCQMTDVKHAGPRLTWKMKCEDGTSGEGDITSGPDSFDGKMTMRTQGNEMHVKLRGKKVGGDCDANEMKRTVQGMQKRAETAQADQSRAQAQQCEEEAAKMSLVLFITPYAGVPPTCKDPSKICARLDTREGLVALREAGGEGTPAQAGKLCKKDLDAVAEKLCAATKKEQEKGATLDATTTQFIFAYCPDLGKALAKRECAGRKFTSLPPAQRDFCTRWAEKRLEGGDQAEREPARAPSGKYLKSGVPDPDGGKYLKSGIPDPDAADEKPVKKAKKKPAEEEEEAKPKDEDVKSRIFKGLFGR